MTFSVEEITRGKITVREVSMPFALSPTDDRSKGGGYIVVDPDDPAHMQELCRQAVTDLERWLRRYEAALVSAGGSVSVMQRQLGLLQSAASNEENAEAA